MRKEVIFAIIIGAIFGVAIVVGIKRLNTTSEINPTTEDPKEVQNTSDSSNQDKNTPPESSDKIFIAISSPENKTVITENPVEISGLTLANTWIAIISEDDEQLIRSNSNGEFKFNIELSGGLNIYKLYAIDADGNKAMTELKLVFTTQLDQ